MRERNQPSEPEISDYILEALFITSLDASIEGQDFTLKEACRKCGVRISQVRKWALANPNLGQFLEYLEKEPETLTIKVNGLETIDTSR